VKLKTIGILILALLLASATRSQAFGWAMVNAKIRSEFPDVRRITTAELAAWLNDPARPAPRLLDVRTRAEFDVSHLRGAKHVEPGAAAATVGGRKDQPIVTYCSVGYRSGAFAKKLGDAGYTNVANLEGSIFRWANEGRPIVKRRAGDRKSSPVQPNLGIATAPATSRHNPAAPSAARRHASFRFKPQMNSTALLDHTLISRSAEPLNLEMPFASLREFVTPNEKFYVRCHFPIPQLDAASWKLRVEGAVGSAVEFTLEDLRAMPRHTGSRDHGMRRQRAFAS
jgi:rhodanese-related sulfurtransferase